MSTQILKSRGASISDMPESEGTIYSEANSAPTEPVKSKLAACPKITSLA